MDQIEAAVNVDAHRLGLCISDLLDYTTGNNDESAFARFRYGVKNKELTLSAHLVHLIVGLLVDRLGLRIRLLRCFSFELFQHGHDRGVSEQLLG